MKETEKKSIIELLDSMLRGNPVELCGVLASTNLLVLETLDRLEGYLRFDVGFPQKVL